MRLLVKNATLVTADNVRAGCAFVVEDDRVAATGATEDFSDPPDGGPYDEIIDAGRCLVTPGFVNTHHHLYQSLTRCLPAVQNRPLFDWLRGLYARWRNLDYRATKLAAKVSICELLLHGCTTTSDHHYMLPPHTDARIEAVLEAAEELGIRIHLCRGSMTLGQSAGGLTPDDCIERDADVLADCMRVLDAYHDPAPHAMRRIDLAPCSPFNVTRELMRDTLALARERGVLLHTHLAETLDEDAYCREHYGCRPLEYLVDMDWLGPDVYLAHCAQLNDDEIGLLAHTRTSVAHCPTSNMRLGSGIAPLEKMLAAGVNVGLAVDGSSSNDCGNLLAEARMALLAARVRAAITGERTAASATPPPQSGEAAAAPDDLLAAARVFRLLTQGGASVLNRPELGQLEPGAAADFALFRIDDLALAGAVARDPLAALLLCDAPRADRVFVAGRELVRDGRIQMLDEDRLAREFNDFVADSAAGGA